MSGAIFDEMKSYVGFTRRDATNLRALAKPVDRYLPAVVDRFYAEILAHSGARQVLAGEEQVTQLRGHFLNWLRTLFGGVYDDAYARQRAAIGHAHVRVGLPQHFIFCAMEVVWQELERIVRNVVVSDVEEKLRSLHKLLMLETGLMADSYRASYADGVRRNEREAVQERLSRVEHLAEVGQLAASLAHELKNPLAGIGGAIQVIRDGLKAEHPQRPVLDEVLRQVDRLDRTVKDLLSYARPQPARFCRVDLNRVIERVVLLLESELTVHNQRLEHETAGEALVLEADEHQLEQLLVNLTLNAAHASSAGDPIRIRATADGQGVRLEVQDQGRGMDEATVRRAFEPFFTTKARGTGLGLAICQRIVETHRGSIALRSVVGKGTTVEVLLPRDMQVEGGESR